MSSGSIFTSSPDHSHLPINTHHSDIHLLSPSLLSLSLFYPLLFASSLSPFLYHVPQFFHSFSFPLLFSPSSLLLLFIRLLIISSSPLSLRFLLPPSLPSSLLSYLCASFYSSFSSLFQIPFIPLLLRSSYLFFLFSLIYFLPVSHLVLLHISLLLLLCLSLFSLFSFSRSFVTTMP